MRSSGNLTYREKRNKRNEVRKATRRRVGLVNRSESGEKNFLLSFAQQEIHHPLTGFQHRCSGLHINLTGFVRQFTLNSIHER